MKLPAKQPGPTPLYPHISRVEIQNFRNFHDFSIDLAPTTVIVGENKVGKSNFIEAIRLLLDPTIPDAARKLRPEDFWDGLGKPFAGNKISIRLFIQDFGGNEGAQAILSDCIVSSNPLTAKLTFEYRSKRNLAHLQGEALSTAEAALDEDDYDFVAYGGSKEDNRIGTEIRKWLALILLPALRDAESDIQSWKKSPLRPLLDRVRKKIPAKHFASVRQNLDVAKETLLKAQPVADLVTSINKRVRSLAGPVHAVETDLDFASSEPEQLVRSLRIFLREKSSKPLSDASLGTANILFLSLLLHDMEMKQAAKEIVSTILAIEEPEAHLHPQLQRLLFRYFLSRKHPLLLTTHSPNIASVAPIDSVILLRATPSGTVGFSTNQLGLTPEQKKDLERYLDVTRAEMLFARGVIFVEGVAEQYLIPVFAETYMRKKGLGNSLDDFGISVCSVNGTDFGPFNKLLSEKGLSLPHVMVTDGDPRDSKKLMRRVKSGNRRGLALMSDRSASMQLEAEDDEVKVSLRLRNHGIFVGEKTLELDLLASFADEMKATYKDLPTSLKQTAEFDEACESAASDPVSADELLRRIESIGKGRFAQTLAGKLAGKPAPDYIQLAIECMVNKLAPADAKPA